MRPQILLGLLGATLAAAIPVLPLVSAPSQDDNNCYTDNDGNQRVLHSKPSQDIPASTMTVDVCVSACKAIDMPVAGLEFGQECYCGVWPPVWVPKAPNGLAECSIPCAGNKTQLCGGINHMLLVPVA